MRVGIFLENFTNTELNKDPETIANGLMALGIEVIFFTNKLSVTKKNKLVFRVITKKEAEEKNFWKKAGISSIIIYSWLSLRYEKMIRAIKHANLKIILKLDSDGNLIHPLKPSFLKVFGIHNNLKSKLNHIIRSIQYSVFSKIVAKKRVKQLDMCDAAIIESPDAKKKLIHSLSYWKRNDLITKLHFIPNPVKTCYGNKAKTNTIICVGRWSDKRKNSKALINIFSKINQPWNIILIGENSKFLAKKINNKKININTFEKLSHDDVLQKMNNSKIFFSPSISESFNLAAAEALTCGCSFAGSPLPSFIFFINSGLSGQVAKSLSTKHLRNALYDEINKWESGKRSGDKISNFWTNELSPKNICKKIIEIL